MGGIMSSGRIKPKKQLKKEPAFDPQAFLDSAGVSRKLAHSDFRKRCENLFETRHVLLGLLCAGGGSSHEMYD
jgi:hypothetical protein